MQIKTGGRGFNFLVTKAVYSFVTVCFLCLVFVINAHARPYKVMVHAGIVQNSIEYLKSIDFWGAERHGEQLSVPRVVIAIANEKWSEESGKIPVEDKKELFYRALLPMILVENEMIMENRDALLMVEKKISKQQSLSQEEQELFAALRDKYQVEGDSEIEVVKELVKRVDIIPPALALGQGAYESGYGTSRFAREGNALFGQWTYGGDGMKPEEHRASKGNYGVASYKWPFDSVRSYMLNLNTHNAYSGLRDKRVSLRAKGKVPTGFDLVPTLVSYSEKGEEYVKTLESIIRHNNLGVADDAKLRDEPFTLVVAVGGEEHIENAEQKIEEIRKSGELDRIVRSMHLENEKSL